MQRSLPTLLIALAACGPAYYTGALDLARAERGEIYSESLMLPDGRFMSRAGAAIDAPPWRVMNALEDVEGYTLWQPMIQSVKLLRSAADQVDFEVQLKPLLFWDLAPALEHLRVDRARGELSSTVEENEWVKNMQTVVKVEALATGSAPWCRCTSSPSPRFGGCGWAPRITSGRG